MDWKAMGAKLLSKKRRRKETGEKDPYERNYEGMDPTDIARAKAIDAANKKRKEREDNDTYACGGVKYDKLKKLLKKKK